MNRKEKICCLLIATTFCGVSACCQVNEDSLLKVQEVKWSGKPNNDLFGFGKPVFGPCTTISILPVDSPVVKRKNNAGKSSSVTVAGGHVSGDQLKTVDLEKTNYYQLLLGTATVTCKSIFGITTYTRKEKQTFLGMLFSKTDEDKTRILFYNRNVSGIIRAGNDTMKWSFYLSHVVDNEIEDGYLTNYQDSFLVKTVNTGAFSSDMGLVDHQGQQVAQLSYGPNRLEIRLQKELNECYKNAIASLFALIVSIKN